ncbi:MAG: hypothetical protein H0V17_03275 [Deltaproteobacteria bacterium]|nr:hypothetical protein [Deltaproteobacteria bacterium]
MTRAFYSILFAAVAATGCVAAEGDESFIIINNLVPEVDDETGEVTFTPNREGPFFSQGFVNPEAPNFFVGSLFESRVQAVEGRESLRTILVEGANISLEVSEVSVVSGAVVQKSGAPETIEFSVRFSSAVSPNGGVAVGIYDVIPFEVMAAIRGKIAAAAPPADADVFVEVTSTTTAFGDFYGDRIDSTSFVFPVVITNTAPSF